jgi:hypothetical protein
MKNQPKTFVNPAVSLLHSGNCRRQRLSHQREVTTEKSWGLKVVEASDRLKVVAYKLHQ